ncbi:Hsp33 family molecular chaperone HslO [Aestuariispira ectoiniformans]|uniref:Hsp33 family molecular chaperone HslO n=1 Tax=Aestuariispira ectoiniformans TaxID=2775080 RepID=UPI00223C37B0|nr:Hsp33 family molecular chaperone HslO [Aestuariispira ectoiniformans]
MTDNTVTLTDDLVQPFMIETSGLSGRLVRLGTTVDTILNRHDIVEPVKVLLGKVLALGAGLATALKYDGIFTIQIKGDGPVSLIVADVTSAGDVRGYAQVSGELPPDEEALDAPVEKLLGKGYLAFTVDQGPEMERYQGIVELKGKNLEDSIDYYFEQSEQFASKAHLAAGKTPEGQWRATCIILQRLPEEGGSGKARLDGDEDWTRACTFMKSATDQEMLDSRLSANDLLFRLFHEDGVRVFDPKPLDVGCRCSREKISTVLTKLPDEDLEHALEDGKVSVTCEFCNITFDFDREQIDELRQS